jgi:16S rRNA processing protein RimM
MADWDDMVLVGIIGRPHGLRGHVVVHPETDFVDERFQVGGTVWTRTPEGERPLTVHAMHVHGGGRVVVGFSGLAAVEDAERLSGCELRVPEDQLHPLADGTYYHHQLVGCLVETATGEQVGQVERVTGGPGGSLLAVTAARGEVLVPLAADICVDVDVAGRRIVIAPPDGLLELNEPGEPRKRGSRGSGRRSRRERSSARV